MRILITGGSGLVATELTHLILSHTNYYVTLLTRHKSYLSIRYKAYLARIECIVLEDFLCNYDKKIDIVVHAAFARTSSGEEIASSLSYLQKLCEMLARSHPQKFINISSQSVYGSNYTSGVLESATPKPDYLYALGKFSSELIASAWFDRTPTEVYNIRLSSVCENARFLRFFVKNALNNEKIILTAPNQIVSFIDVRDVASALLKVIENNENSGGLFNLGSGKWYTIHEVTKAIEEVGMSKYLTKKLQLVIEDEGNVNSIGMNCKAFNDTFQWFPSYNLDDMITSLYELLINVNMGGGGYPYHLD